MIFSALDGHLSLVHANYAEDNQVMQVRLGRVGEGGGMEGLKSKDTIKKRKISKMKYHLHKKGRPYFLCQNFENN